MKNQLFKFENNEVRTVEIDNELWFIAKDVAKILEYSDTFKMCNRLDDDEKLNRQFGGSGQRR